MKKIEISPSDNVNFKFTTYSENFAFNIESDPQITVSKQLNEDIITDNQEILLILEANRYDSKDTAVIQLKLPHITPEPVKFAKPSYTYSYNPDSKSLTGDSITISNFKSGLTVTINDGQHKDHFSVKVNDDKSVSLNVDTALDQDILDEEVDILLTLKASVEGDDDCFTTALINLPKKQATASAKFAQSSYLGIYVLGEETDGARADSVNLNSAISLQNDVSATVDFAETSDNFELVKSDTSYTIKVKKNLEDSELIGKADIVLNLIAIVDNADDGLATVVVQLPKEIAPPAFTQAVYQAEYKTDSDLNTIELTTPIEQSGSYLSQSHIELINPDEFKDNFKLSDSAPYQIIVDKNLEPNVLQTKKDIILTLRATLDGSSLTTTSTIVVKLPDILTAPKFRKPLYTAKYEVKDELATVTVDGEQISTDATDENSVIISLETYSENFKVSYDSNKKSYQFTVLKQLTDTGNEIYVILDATVDGAKDYTSATVAIKMSENAENVVPEFSQSYYEATYDNDNQKITMGTTPITITSDHASETIVKVIGSYESNFDATLNENSWILKLKSPLNPETLEGYEIIVELQASLPKSSKVGKSAVIINLQNPTKLDPTPKFSKPLYEAEYRADGSIESDDISITSNREEAVIVSLTTYELNFKITRDSDSKIWKLETQQPLTDEDLKTNKELVIVLNAHLDNSVADGSATLKIKLPEATLEFDKTYYHATYQENNSVKLEETITLTKGATVEIKGDYADSFKVDCTETCTITVSKELSPEILASETEVILVLEASKPDVAEKSTATVIIALPLQETAKAPEFEKPVYVAVYNSDKTITIEDPQITIVGLTNINEITMTLEGTYNTDFSINPKNDHWEITVNNLSESIISKEISIQLTLIAQKTGVKVAGKAALVVQLPKKIASSDFYFEKNVYMADYNEDTKDLTTVDEISITGDTDTSADVTFSGDNANLFDKPTYVNSKITLKLKDGIPDDIIKNNVAISVDIIATKASEPESATTTLVIRLPKTESDSLSFTEVTYTASYTVVEGDNNDKVEIENALIKINGETDATKVDLTIEDPNMQKYFKLIPESDHWTIGVVEDYPTDDNVSILLILQAVKGSLQGKVGVVIKLPKKVVAKSFNFKQNVYTGDYSVGDDEHGILNIPEVITVVGNDLDQVLIELSGNYKAYFNQTFENGVVKITLKSDLADEILNNQVVITVDIVATKASETDIATLVLTLPKKVTPTTLYFDNNIYLADYKIDDDDDVDFSLEKEITLVGASADVILTISGDYNNNFGVTNSNGKISLTLVKELDSEIVDSETAITLDITAKENDETTKTSVVIKLPKADTDSSDDKSGLIAAISVLAVLLVAALVGSAVFYYFKFRRGNSYSNMEDSRPSERFRKNSRTEGTNKFEHPTRRPTGVIKYPLDDVAGETEDTEPELNLDKRKSVQFDTINVDELEIEKSEDDLESNYDTLDVEDKENLEAEDDERRISKV